MQRRVLNVIVLVGFAHALLSSPNHNNQQSSTGSITIPTNTGRVRNDEDLGSELTLRQEGIIQCPLGPPGRVDELQVGGDPLSLPRSDGSSYQVQKLSCNPPIFLLQNFLSVLDCDEIMQAAAREMNPAETTEGDGNILRRHCRVAWLDHDTGIPLIKTMGRTTGNLLLTDDVKGCPKAGCEKLQVLHYFDTGGEFVLHHDGVGRVLTVIYYLNGVAGTWFPLADKMLTPIPQNRDEALRYAQDCIPGRDGILIAGRHSPLRKDARNENTFVVNAGDCVAFYNYHIVDAEGDAANWQSLHAGLPTTEREGDKWIANHWMHAPSLFRNVKTHFRAV